MLTEHIILEIINTEEDFALLLKKLLLKNYYQRSCSRADIEKHLDLDEKNL